MAERNSVHDQGALSELVLRGMLRPPGGDASFHPIAAIRAGREILAREMSKQNLALVRRMYEAFHAGDADGALAHFHPEVVVDATARPDGRIGHGRAELDALISSWLGAFEEWREEIEEMRDLGAQVYVIATQRGRGKGSGVEVESRYALLYDVEEDKITRMTLFSDPDEALRAARAGE